MADENKLWFEMGVRDYLTQTLQKGVELADKMGQGLDNATKKAATYAENVAKLKDGYYKIDEAIEKINKSLGEAKDPAMKAKMQQTLQELEKLRNGLKAIEGDDKKMMESGAVAAHMRQNNFALMTRSVNRYTQSVQASERANRSAQSAEEKRVDQLRTRYNDLARIRERLSNAIIGAAPGVDTSKASSVAAQIWREQMSLARATKNGGRGYTTTDSDYKKLKQDAVDAAAGVERLTREQERLNRQQERDSAKRAAAALREQAAAAKATAQANMDLVAAYDKVTEAGKRTNVMWEQMKSYAGTFVSFYGLKSLLNDVIQIGGEFEVQHIALKSILGDIEQANTMFNEMKQLAVVSPFNFKQLATYSKQVAAFGIPYEEMYDTTKRLADISAGLGVDMNRLILAFGQVRSAAVLRGQELRQFTEAGIPMVKALADEFTKLNGRVVTTGEVFELISKRAVPFEMVKKILWEMTDEGGRFYNMQYELADTLAGKWSNLQDAWEIMLSEFARGESLSGKVLKTMVTWTTTLIENLNKIAPLLGGLAIGWGVGKVVGLATNGITLGEATMAKRIAQAQKLNAIKIRERYIQGEINASEMQSLMIRNRDTNMWRTQLALAGRMNTMQLLRMNYQSISNRRMLVTLVQMGQIDRAMAKLIMKGRVLEVGIRSLGNAMKTAFGPLGWAMIAIDIIVAGLMSAWSSSNELNESIKTAFDSIKQRYEDVSQFIKNTPIEVAIKTGDLDEMKNMIQMYKDQLRSNFPDVADAIIGRAAGTDGGAYMTDAKAAERMLKNLRDELQIMNNIQEKAKALASAFATAADEANKWNTEGVKDNMQDFQDAINDFKNRTKEWSENDFRDFAKKLQEAYDSIPADKFGELSDANKDYLTMLRDLGVEINKMLNQGNSLEAVARRIGWQSSRISGYVNSREPVSFANSTSILGAGNKFNIIGIDNKKGTFDTQIKEMYDEIKKAIEQQNESLANDQGRSLFHILATQWMGDNEFSAEMRTYANMFWDNLMMGDYDSGSNTLPKILADQMKNLNPELAKAIASGTEMDEAMQKKAQDLYTAAKDELIAKYGFDFIPLMEKTFGQGVEIPFKVVASLGDAPDVLTGWRKTLQAKLDKTPVQIKMGMNMEQIVEEIRKAYGTAETTINKLGPIAIHAGIKLDGIQNMDISKYQFTNPQLYNTLKALQDALASQGQTDAFAKANGLDFSDMKKDGSHKDGDKTDKALQALEKEYELYKKFWGEYEKYSQMYGKEGAMRKLQNDAEFKTVFGWNLSDLSDYAKSVEEIQRRLKGGVGKSGDRRSFFDSMNADVQAQRRKEEAAAITSVNDALKTQLGILNEQYETYKKLYKLTGDQRGAASVAFGGRMMQSATYKDYLVQQMTSAMGGDAGKAKSALSMDKKTFNDTYGQNSEKMSIIYTAYQEHLVKLQKESLDLLLSTIEKNRTIEQQIEDENRNYQYQLSLLKEIRDPQMRAEAEKGLTKEHEKKSSKLQFEQFKEGSNWVKIFDDLDRVSMRTIESMIEKVENFSLTVGLSVEEVKALRDALEKLRNEQANRDPFTAMAENVRLGTHRNQLLHSGVFSKDANGQWQGNYTFQTEASAKRYGYKKGQTISADDLQDDIRSNRSGFADSISKIGDKFKALQDVMQPVVDLFAALGNEDLSNLFQMGNNALGAAAGAANGLNALGLSSLGPYGAAAAAGLSIMGSLFAMHDAAIEKEIQASKERQKLLENLVKNMETMLEHTMGGLYTAKADDATMNKLAEYKDKYDRGTAAQGRLDNGTSENKLYDSLLSRRNYVSKETADQIQEAQQSRSYYDAYKANLMAQRDEAAHQMESEKDKKDSDDGKIADYEQQIKELNDQIRYLAEEMAKDLYSIDYKSWAGGLAEALVSAWEAGGNAADAYKKKITSILKEVGTKVIMQKYLEPLLEKNMEEFMKYFEDNNGVLDERGMEILARMYDDADKAAEMTNAYLDGLEKIANQHGETLKNTEESSGQSAIKSITEDQTNLLLSYINAMRADLSIHVQDLRRLMDQVLPDMSRSFGAQLAKLEEIRKEVARGADGVDKMNQKLDQLMTGVKKLSVKVYA
ncbi:tape measure protein [Prevotella communis]|uniref:tape measure protein n=1 Tax=Prevotella communis TaxID=2913614 RepID=UPI001EDBF22E|nr:tape measure protein [Prevotella communis]UKK61115.1 tape measure protein [Prevotella communis]UKK63939.1 tape measure protein [Prevotella communis]